MSTPAVDQQLPPDGPWRPPQRAYEQPPSRPLPLNLSERREAVRFWKQAGVLDERGRVAHDWRVVVGTLFDVG